MTGEVVLYTHPMSRGRIARWMLEEVGCTYRTELMEYGPSMKSAAFLAINPMGKIPVVTHGDVVVTETAAICAYLADAFPAAGLAPPYSLRGAYYRWMFFAAGPLEQAVINKAMGVELPEGKSGMAGFGTLEMTLETIEGVLAKGPYALGEAFSTADVLLGSQLGFAMAFGNVPPRPAFREYVARLQARPARVRAEALDGPMARPTEAPIPAK